MHEMSVIQDPKEYIIWDPVVGKAKISVNKMMIMIMMLVHKSKRCEHEYDGNVAIDIDHIKHLQYDNNLSMYNMVINFTNIKYCNITT